MQNTNSSRYFAKCHFIRSEMFLHEVASDPRDFRWSFIVFAIVNLSSSSCYLVIFNFFFCVCFFVFFNYNFAYNTIQYSLLTIRYLQNVLPLLGIVRKERDLFCLEKKPQAVLWKQQRLKNVQSAVFSSERKILHANQHVNQKVLSISVSLSLSTS